MNKEDFFKQLEKYNLDMGLIREVFKYAEDKHKEQKRDTGEPYITHPAEVALITTEFKPDTELVCAALLHDVVEDTKGTLKEIEQFGDEITYLVDGATMDKSITDKKERTKRYHQKIREYGERDSRLYYLKFADILHNIRSMIVKGEERVNRYVENVRNFYIPLAKELGESELAQRLEEWCDVAPKINII